jgi:glycosyltransferase involved in cell wall biosynthesis
LVSEKNVNRIIDAFATLAKEHPDWDLHIYGDGPRRAALQAQVVSAGLSERVLFFGQTLEPWRVMAESDAFVMASQREGFPNALLEAMAIGLPCVTTDCPSGPREISAEGKFALLVPPNDPDALAQAIGKLMANPTLRQNLGDSARLSVNQRYALTGVLSMWDDAFVALGLKP